MMLGLGSLIPDMAWGEGQDELLGGPAFGDIVRAVEWQESRGRDDAVSPKGAYGAMQLMPGAVVDYARAHGLPTDPQTIETLRRDPKRNREIGAWYLQQVQDQFGGEMVPALAAYNAGPGRVKRILAGFGGKYSPQIEADFIAQLPAETRDYIAKIKGRLGDAGPSQEAAPMPYEMMGRPPTPEELAARARITSNPSVQDGIERDWQPEMRSGGPRGAGISALGARPQAQGLSGLNPYLQIASQLMPERQGRPWADALINAGAAMMQSNRPDFLGGVGAGLQAANQSMARDEEQRYRDQVGTLDLGLKMAQLGQKEAKQPLIKEFKEGDRIVTKQWNGAMWVPLADAPAYRPDKPGEVETLIRLAGIDPESSAGRAMAARILERKAKGEDGGPFPGSSIDASSYNNMIAYNEKVRTGQPTTPQEDMAYSIAYQHASKPTRWQTPDGAMYEAPGIDVSGMVPPKVGAPSPAAVPSTARQTMPPTASAGQPEQRPTGAAVGSQPGTRQIVPPDEKPVAGDSAGRFALVPEARQALEQAQTAYFPDGKSFDRTLAGVAWANVPGTRGAEVFNAVSRAIANRLRIESGAAAPPAEVEAMVKRYLPAPWDSDELARQKLEGLKQYFDAFATSATKGAGPAIREEGRAPPRAAQQPANDMPPPEAFATMDRAAIDQLTPRVSDMTDAQLRALHARRRVLLGISPGSGMTGEGGAP